MTKKVKKDLIAIAISAIIAGNVSAQTASTRPANAAVTEITPGFAPPGLADMSQQPTTKIDPSKIIATKSNETKTRQEIAAAESRKFKPSGKKIVVSESAIPPDYFYDSQANSMLMSKELSQSSKLGASIKAKQGEPIDLVIAINALNRIVTPFADAVVDTVSDIQVKKAGGVIMIATANTEPASIIIREKEQPELALMINLMPQAGMLARDVKINASFAKNNSGATSEFEKDTAHPISVKLKNILRDLAKGKIPVGFTLEKGNGQSAKCDLPGFETKEAQVLLGSSMTIRVYAARNLSENRNELDERGCSSRQQLAAAAWPRIYMAKGEKTELFVIEAPAKELESALRPSAI